MRASSTLGLLFSLCVFGGIYIGCGSTDDGGSSSGGSGGASGDASAGSGGTAGTAGSGGSSAGAGGSSAAGSSGAAGNAAAGGTSGGAGVGGWPGGSGGDASVADAPPDVDFPYDAPVQEAGDACAATTAEAKPVPLDIFIMLDRSGSMGTDCNFGATTTSKWCRAVNSIGGFVQDAASIGNQLAIQYFPRTGGSCNGSGYDVAAVGLGFLTGPGGFAQTVIDSLNAETPNGSNTPTEGGLRGLIGFTAAHVAPPRVMIGIFITDGQPNGCNEGPTFMRDLLAAHYNTTGIHTFVVGMTGASFATLETISDYGGALSHNNFCGTAAPCHHYSVGDGDPSVFIEALKQIQQSAVGCSFQMPASDAGIIDPDKVTVQYTPGGTPPPQDLTRVNDLAACVPNGWYYDNNTAPTIINLCPDTCTTVQADPNAKVEVLLGCLGS